MSTYLFATKDSPDWTVVPIFFGKGSPRSDRLKHYELRFQGKSHKKCGGGYGRITLQDMADFMNRRGMVPRKKIECLADK